MTISVIIPVLHEQDQINGIINHLRCIDPDVQIIVVDGDPGGSTIAVIADDKVFRLVSSMKGRGNQLTAGTAIASGDILVMLHADTFLPSHAFSFILAAISRGADWGSFRLGIDATSPPYRLIERFVDLRCTLFELPYGDQAIFVSRAALLDIGGVPAIPLMEDVALARKLRQAGFRFALLPERVRTSARRWQQDGVVRRTLCNWLLLLRYLSGADPKKLAKHYRAN